MNVKTILECKASKPLGPIFQLSNVVEPRCFADKLWPEAIYSHVIVGYTSVLMPKHPRNKTEPRTGAESLHCTSRESPT